MHGALADRGHPGRRWVIDAGLLAAAAFDALIDTSGWGSAWTWVTAGLALSGVLLRRHSPRWAFVATLPGLTTSFALVAALITLFELSRRTSSRRVVVMAAAATCGACMLNTPLQYGMLDAQENILDGLYGALAGAAPTALGQLVRAQTSLRHQLIDLDAAHRTEQRLREQQVLERERTRLAREMHDVVSHQVSLIAVQAGALQVGERSEGARQAGRTIRELAVSTLEELRHMVEVLRTQSPGASSLHPQPGLKDLPALINSADLDVDLDIDTQIVLDQHAQRAVYRTVQEGLTNVRKHAPGARVWVTVMRDGDEVHACIANSAAAGPPLSLPHSGLGLVGLRERAELAGGVLDAHASSEGGFTLVLRIPVRKTVKRG